MSLLSRLRTDATEIVRRALERVDAAVVLREGLTLKDGTLGLGARERWEGAVWLIGAGKASGRMAEAAEQLLGARVQGGLVLVPHGTTASTSRTEIWHARHPVPDEAGVRGTQALIELVAEIPPDDLVLVLLTGGASSLLVAPAEGLGLSDLQEATRTLLAAGVDIHEINTVRRHLSAVAGGWLAAHLHPRRSWTLAISDVVGDDLTAIGSGPTTPDPTTFAQALAVWERAVGVRAGTDPVGDHLRAGVLGRVDETPKPGEPWFWPATHAVLANLHTAADAAAWEAARRGYATEIIDLRLTGEARHVGATLGARARELRASTTRTTCLLFGGETTVTLRGGGTGGRNQEVALAAAAEIAGLRDTLVFSLGTDGVDGPTDVAGAIVDGGTTARIRAAGLDPKALLADNDSFRALAASGDHVRLPPTHTNVMDLMGVLVHA